MPDYDKLIDAETWAFIRETEKWYGPDSAQQSVEEHRRRYDAMCRAFFHGYPANVTARDIVTDDVLLRLYQRQSAKHDVTVLFSHGGSFLVGGLDSHDDVCAEICDATGYDVVAVDYRLHPEFDRQDALDDVQKALNWIRRRRSGKVISVGDSAGGYLTAGIVHANREVGDMIGQVLIYPGLNGDSEGGSLDEHAFAPLLTRAEILEYQKFLRFGFSEGSSGHHIPLRDEDYSNLPVTVAFSAECDPIADDAKHYAEAVNLAGGKAIWILDKGLVHGHLRARHTVKRARASFDSVLTVISLIGVGLPFERSDIETSP